MKKIGLYSLLAILAIILKATGVLAWSWWIILIPIYLPLVILISFSAVVGIKFMNAMSKWRLF